MNILNFVNGLAWSLVLVFIGILLALYATREKDVYQVAQEELVRYGKQLGQELVRK